MSAYRSTLAKRTRPVDQTDFEAVPYLTLGPKVSEYLKDGLFLGDWDRLVPFLPQDLYRFSKDIFRADVKTEVWFLKVLEPCLPDKVAIKFSDLAERSFSCSFSYENGLYENPEEAHIFVEPKARGRGFGKAWLQFLTELSVALDQEKIYFTAGNENGGYTWAKAGVGLDIQPDNLLMRQTLSERLIGRLEAVKDFIPSPVYGRARSYSRALDKKDLCAIADIDYALPDEACDAICKELGRIHDNFVSFYQTNNINGEKPVVVALGERFHVAEAFHAAQGQGKQLSLARYLLSHTIWDAVVDLQDEQQMQRIGAYVGGWKTIEPKDEKMPAVKPALGIS